MLARFAARALGIAAVTAAMAVSGLTVTVTSAVADAASATDPATVTADALPTVQIDGVVWDQAIVGNTVYAVGSFATARPAGSAAGVNTVARANILAYNLTTGALIDSFAPTTNAEVKAVAASPDGRTIYIGGNFTTVNGASRYRVAALDATTGALVNSFAPVADTVVNALSVSPDGQTVYLGGNFSSINKTTQAKFAAVTAANGALLPQIAATVAGGSVQGVTVSPDGTKVVIGGNFTTVNSSANPGYGMAMFDTTSGAMLSLPANSLIKNAGTGSAVTSLTSDADGFYGTGYNYSSHVAGSTEGTFMVDWSGNEVWIQDCHGDSYSAAVLGNVVYTASHHHYCGNAGGFPQTSPWTYYRATAATKYATGLNQRDMYGYNDHTGEPTPGELNWFPNINSGTYTGLGQGPWSVAASGNYVVYGGEFTTVNGTAQQGLVRFAKASIAPDKQGPRVYGANLTVTAKSNAAGQVRVIWPGNYDRDDSTLTYTLYRDDTNTIAWQGTQTAKFWNTQQMSYTDTGLVAGSTHQYKLKVTDPSGNAATSDWVSVTVSGTGSYDTYAQKVLDLGASTYYRLDDTGATVADLAGQGDTTAGSAVTRGSAGALKNSSDTSSTFKNDTNSLIVDPQALEAPDTFTTAIWFKTNTYGKLVGFGSSNTTANSSSYDRQLYLTSDGKLNFGVNDGSKEILTSPSTYTDNAWHLAVASMGADGAKLYVDGKEVAERSDVTRGAGYTGYWHVGGDAVWSGRNRFVGSLDEFAVFQRVLSPAQVASLYNASGSTAGVPTAPSDSYGSTVYNDNPNLYWRLGETSGTTAADSSTGNLPGTIAGNYTLGATGVTSADKAITLGASTSGGFFGIGAKAGGTVTASRATYSPKQFTEEAWIKTTSTTGGRILGFGNASGTTTSSSYDRMLWMLDSGKVAFGVGGNKIQLTSAKALNDGNWHHVVATFGSVAGAQLYIDGALDSASTAYAAAANYSGYWRVGPDATWGGNTNSYFNGAVDEAAVYPTVLSAMQIRSHYTAAGFTAVNNPPKAAATLTASGLAVTADGTASTDSDGQVVSYAWNFGDGTTGSGATATHTYAAGGTYTVTLTVTDDGGATNTTTSTVVVNAPPTASFTTSVKKLAVSLDGTGSTDSDGTVASYAWDFGDNSTGTGATATHTYTTPGTYTITLTVTDNAGATGTTTRTVTVAANQPPVAAFTSTATGLTTVFDGTTSADPDGDALTYAWDFGDGTAATTATASHTYAVAGTYVVKLTVTDTDGATNVATANVTVASAATVAQDDFTRTTNSGWGNADIGGGWTVSGGAAKYYVNGSQGVMTLNAASMTRTAILTGVSLTDADVTAKLSLDTLATGNGTQIGLLGRSIDAQDNYIARLRLGADNTVRLQIVKTVGGTATTLQDVATGLTHQAGQVYHLRFQATGTSPTTLQARVWIDGANQPTTWTATTTDTTTVLQAPGAVGAWAYTSGSTTNVPQNVAIDAFAVTHTTTPAAGGAGVAPVVDPAQLAQDAFTRVSNAGWGTADIGGAWTVTGGASKYSIDGARGLMVLNAASTTRSATLDTVTTSAADVTAALRLDTVTTGTGTQIGLLGRSVDAKDSYLARLRLVPDGTVRLQLVRTAAGTPTTLQDVLLTGITHHAGQVYHLRFRVTGTSPTTLQARAWLDGTTEPTSWQATASDSTAGLQAAGSAGPWAYSSGSSTNFPQTVAVDNFSLRTAG